MAAPLRVPSNRPDAARAIARRAGADGSLMLDFEVTEPGRPAFVEIFLTPNHVGFVEGVIGLRGQPALRFTQFVYP